MRANYVGNTALQERLNRANPEVRTIVEAVSTSQQDTKETQPEWQAVDSQTGLRFPDIGGAQLDRDTDAIHAVHSTAAADQDNVITDLDNVAPWFFLELEWTEIDNPTFEIKGFTARIDPDVNDSGREAQKLRCQIFSVTEHTGNYTDIMAVSRRAEVDVGGNAEADFTFDFGTTAATPPTPQSMSPEPEDPLGPESPDPDDEDTSTNARTWILIWGVTGDGDPAGNIAWVGDADDNPPTVVDDGDGNPAATASVYKTDRVDDAEQVAVGGRFSRLSTPSVLPDFDLRGTAYTEATASFTGSSNEIDLGSAPAADTDLVVIAQGEEPDDSSLTWEISDDSGSTWTEVVDGDVIGEDNTPGGNDLSGVSRQQTYAMRVTLTPSSDGHSSPFARRLGVEELTVDNLDGLTAVSAGNWGFDPATLVGEIPEATIRIAKDGLRDYRSEGERLLAENHIGDLSFRVWIGHPDLDRQDWLLVDTFDVDDYDSQGGDIEITALSPLRRLQVTIPPYDISAAERVPVQMENETLKSAWDNLIDTQISLAARYRGPGVEDTSSQGVTKTLRDSDGKTELDAIAHLAGGTVISSQGRVKFQNTFASDQGGVRAVFFEEEINVRGLTPGFKNRIPEYFVPHSYDRDQGNFGKEVRSFHSPTITKLGQRGFDGPEELRDEVARWIPVPNVDPATDKNPTPDDNLAGYIAHRTVSPNGIGPGLKQIRFDSTVLHPELEPGDVVAVQTDDFVIRDTTTGEPLRGPLWLLGVVQVQHDVEGRQFTVWVQQVMDEIPSEEDADRQTGPSGPAEITGSVDRAAGTATITVDITGPGSYDIDIYRIETDGTETNVSSTAGVTDGGANDPVTHTESLREAEVLLMRVEVTSSNGELVQVEMMSFPQDEISDVNTLSGAIDEPDGSVIVSAGGDNDTATIYIRVDENAVPADPDGTEDNTTAGQAVIDARSGVVDTDLQIDEQSLAYIKARGETPSGQLGRVEGARVERPASNLIGVGIDQTISGSAGQVYVTVDDPHLRVTAIEFAEKTGPGGYGSWSTAWDSSTGTIGSDTTLTRSEAISLLEKHNVAIKVRVQYTDRSGNTRTYLPNAAVFDIDKIPEVNSVGSAIDDSDGSVIGSAGGDDDVANIYVTVGENGDPADPTAASNDGQISGRSGSVDTGVVIAEGSTAHVKYVGETSGGTLGPVKTDRVTRPTDTDTIGLVEVSTDEIDNDGDGDIDTGVLDVTVRAEAADGTWEVETRTRQGGGTWTSWSDAGTGLSTGDLADDDLDGHTDLVTLIEGKLSFIGWQLKNGANEILAASVVEYDANVIPQLQTLSATANPDGTVAVHYGGDADTGSVVVSWGTGISDADDTIDGRTGSVTSSDALSPGESVTVTVTPWTQIGATGTSGTAKEARASLPKSSARLVSVDLTVFDDGTDDQYSSSWDVPEAVDDTYDLDIQLMRAGGKTLPNVNDGAYSMDATVTETSPATTTSRTDNVATGDDAGDAHKARFRLKDDAGDVVDEKTALAQSRV